MPGTGVFVVTGMVHYFQETVTGYHIPFTCSIQIPCFSFIVAATVMDAEAFANEWTISSPFKKKDLRDRSFITGLTITASDHVIVSYCGRYGQSFYPDGGVHREHALGEDVSRCQFAPNGDLFYIKLASESTLCRQIAAKSGKMYNEKELDVFLKKCRRPTGLCISARGDVIVADRDEYGQTRIGILRPETWYTMRGECAWVENKRFITLGNTRNGADLCASENGDLVFVAHTSYNCIRQLDLRTSTVSILAGDGGVGNQDGDGAQARFNHPEAIDIHPHLEAVVVCDTHNQQVRLVQISDGYTSTITCSKGDEAWRTIAIESTGDVLVASTMSVVRLHVPSWTPETHHMYRRWVKDMVWCLMVLRVTPEGFERGLDHIAIEHVTLVVQFAMYTPIIEGFARKNPRKRTAEDARMGIYINTLDSKRRRLLE